MTVLSFKDRISYYSVIVRLIYYYIKKISNLKWSYFLERDKNYEKYVTDGDNQLFYFF